MVWFVIGMLISLLILYAIGLSSYAAEIKVRVDRIEKAITKCGTSAKDQNSIATTTNGSNVDHERND